MAKSGGDSNSIRDEEVEVETRAAYAGKGMDDSAGQYKMPKVTGDTSESMCQSAADAAKSYNQGGGEDSGTDVY